MRAGAGIDQLRRDAHLVALALNRTLQHVASAEVLAHGADVDGLVLVDLRGVPRDHVEIAEAGEVRDHFLGDARREPGRGVISCVGVERQHRDRRTCGCRLGAPEKPPRSARQYGEQGGDRGERTAGGQPAPAWPRRAVHPDAIGAYRPIDVLDLLLAREVHGQRQLTLQVIEGGAGDEHAAGLADLLEACGDIHPVPEQILPVDDDVAEIDADPQHDAARSGNVRLALCRRPLHAMAQDTASTTELNSAIAPSPITFTIGPWCAARAGRYISGAAPSCAARVSASSCSISRE